MSTIGTNCLDIISGAPKDSRKALHGNTGKGTKNKMVHTNSGGFPTSPVKQTTTCTAASFLLNHSDTSLTGYENEKFNQTLPPMLLMLVILINHPLPLNSGEENIAS